MHKKRLPIVFLPFLFLLVTPFVTQAATITTCVFDKETYQQGQTGHITVTIYNDKAHKIRVTELTGTIEYYYTDGNVYIQSFFTDATLPTEIQQGQSSIFHIPFSLPTNVATGYTDIYVKAKTELWSIETERWVWSDHPTYQPTLYIESPYKQQSEQRLLMIYLFGVATIVLAVVTVFLWVLKRRASFFMQPIVQ